MASRLGVTEKVSISIDREQLTALRKRAKRLHGGNLSAVIAELAVDAQLLEGMNDLVSWLGGPSLSDEDRVSIDRELAGKKRIPNALSRSKRPKSKSKSKNAA